MDSKHGVNAGPQATVSAEVLGLIAEISGEPEAASDPDIRLFDLQILDSLATVELIVALSDRFDIDIAPSEIDRDTWATPALITSFIIERLGR